MQNYYLMIDGINGSSTNPQYPNGFEVASFSYGANVRVAPYTEPPKYTIQDMHFIMADNSASPQLYQAAHDGTRFTQAMVVVVKSGEGPSTQAKTLKIALSDVMVASFQAYIARAPDVWQTMGAVMDTNAFTLTFAAIDFVFGVAASPQATVRPAHLRPIAVGAED